MKRFVFIALAIVIIGLAVHVLRIMDVWYPFAKPKFPGSWIAYDSLGEALLEKGHKERAREMYQQSIDLNFMNGNGHVALKRMDLE